MAKAQYQITEALPGGALHTFDYEMRMNNSLIFTKVGQHAVIEGDIKPNLADLVIILDAGGEVFNYLVVVKMPLAELENEVLAQLPDSEKPIQGGTTQRSYNDWISPNNFWSNETHFYFLSQTVGGVNLKASEIRTLFDNGAEILLSDNVEFTTLQNP
jgi:hypothetical protein